MKKIITLTSLVCSFLMAYAQDISFPTAADSVIWTYLSPDAESSIEVYTNKDSIICGQQWTQLKKSDNESLGWTRQEGDRVYYRGGDCMERAYTMYDFSLQAGDSIYCGNTYLKEIGVQDADSVLYHVWDNSVRYYGEIPRRTVTVYFRVLMPNVSLSVLYFTTWVEGIGDIFSPLPVTSCLGIDFCESWELACAVSGEETIYANAIGDDLGLCTYGYPNRTHLFVDEQVAVAGGDGHSWGFAFDNLRSALQVADYGDTIWIAEGTYFPTLGLDRQKTFQIPNGVQIYGGFAGTENFLDERDITAHPTILSGNIGDPADSTDNSYHVLYASGLDSLTLLDGLTITAGQALHLDNTYFGSLNFGGGMLLEANETFPICTPRIRNCTFIGNTAKTGGGIAIMTNDLAIANPLLEHCTFINNRGLYRAGAYYKTGENPDGQLVAFNDCTFYENWSLDGAGGVMLFRTCGDFRFNGCVFERDTAIALQTGAVTFWSNCESSSVYFEDCDFRYNYGNSSGGFDYFDEIYGNEATGVVDSFDFRFINCNFIENRNRNGSGGAISIEQEDEVVHAVIENCIFDGNSSSQRGGAVKFDVLGRSELKVEADHSVFRRNESRTSLIGGGMEVACELGSYKQIFAYTYINNCIFESNTGALVISSGSSAYATTAVTNCTFFNNGLASISKSWNAIFDDDPLIANEIHLSNCIIWEPDNPLYLILYNGDPFGQTVHDYFMDHCIISAEESACGYPGGEDACGEGVIYNENPLFLSEEAGDLRLAGCSPAINAGRNESLDGLNIDYDLDDNQRIQEGTVDIGAYERPALQTEVMAVPENCFGANDGGVEIISSNGELPLTYFWVHGFYTGTELTNLAPGHYELTVTDAKSCEQTFELEILPAEEMQATYEIVPASGQLAFDGNLIFQELTGGHAPYSYQWNTGDTSASIQNAPPGFYELTVTDDVGCHKTFHYLLDYIDAVDEVEHTMVRLFPNPVSGEQEVIIQLSDGLPGIDHWELINSYGQLIKQGNSKLSTSSLSAGVYWVKLYFENDKYWVGRLVVI